MTQLNIQMRRLAHIRTQLPVSLSFWLFAAALFMNPLTGVRVGVSMSYGDLLFAVSAFFGFVERMINREEIYFFPIYLLGALLITLSYVANQLAPEPFTAFDYLQFINACINNHVDIEFSQAPNFRILFASAVLFPQAFLLQRPRSIDDVRFLVYVWTAGAVYGACFTVLFCIGLVPGHEDHFWAVIHRARGLTLHPNAMALSCTLAFPGILLLFLEAKTVHIRALSIALAVITWRAINYSGSRTAIYTLAAMSLAMFLLMYREMPPRIRIRLIGVALSVVCGYMAIKYAMGPVTEYSAFWRLENGSNVSDTIRANDQEIAIAGFINAPVFGQGYQWLRIAHNMYLQVLHSAGLVGLIGYLLVLLFPLYMTWRTEALFADRRSRLLRNSLATAAFGVIVWGWAQTNINALNPTIPFGMLLYVSVALYKRTGHPAGPSVSWKPA